MKKEAVVLTLLLLLGISTFAPFFSVSGQLGVNIYLVTPTQGVAGERVNVQGTIDTTNGTYEIYLGGKLVATDKSEGYYVNANFTAPELPASDYTITLRDVALKQNATETFTLSIGYSIAAITPDSPKQLQEGSSVVLNVTLTGAKPSTAYSANITVKMPSPIETEYSQMITLSPASQTGTARAEVTFPSSEFEPSGSLTNFTGTYTAYFNKTQLLASSQFQIGFTDAYQYHRGDKVSIRAIGYKANQPASVKITSEKTSSDLYVTNVTASVDGVVTSSWTVPNDAPTGIYQAKITPEGVAKDIIDAQNFTLPGYPVTIRTLRLDETAVPGILVEAVDRITNEAYSSISSYDGTAVINLEKGSANLTAYWNGVKVGTATLAVTGEKTHDLVCSLINLKIVVKDNNDFLIPFVALNITYTYKTTQEGELQTGNAFGQTDISGAFVLETVLPEIDYRIDASLYRVIFNSGNNIFTDIPAVPTHEIVILLPSYSLSLKVLDYNMQGLPDARVALSEQTSGIFFADSTDANGEANLEVAFGKYQLSIYTNNVLLNETTIQVFSDTQSEIVCVLYNLKVSVHVVDYLGRSMANVNVDFIGPDQAKRSGTTLSDGTVTFNNVIGGNVWLVAYPSGAESKYEALALNVASPTAVEIKFSKYVLFGSFLVETSLLFLVAMIVSAIAVIAVFEFFRRRKVNSSANSVKPNSTQN